MSLTYCNTCWKHIGSIIKAWGRTFEPCTCEVPTPDKQRDLDDDCRCEACLCGESSHCYNKQVGDEQ